MKMVRVTQDPEKPVPVEVIAESITSMADGIRKLRAGPLKDSALFILIQRACPGVGRFKQKPSMGHVRAMLEGIESLESEYLKGKPKPVDSTKK